MEPEQEAPQGRARRKPAAKKRIQRTHTPLSRAADRTGPGEQAEQVWSVTDEGHAISRRRRVDVLKIARALRIKQLPIRQRIAR